MATLAEIASHTGLAISTVSKYFNGGSVRKYNRDKIEEALKTLDYHPNLVARSLKTKKTGVFGLLLPNLQSSFDTNFVTAITTALSSKGCGTILCLYENDTDKEASMLQFLRDKQVDGVVLLPSGIMHKEFNDFIKAGKKLVVVDRPIPGLDVASVLINNEEVAYEAVTMLISKGHRNIALMTNSKVYTGARRLEGYRKALEDNGIPCNPSYIKDSSWTIANGRKIMMEILDGCPEVSAVFACSEEFAIGAYQILGERGIHVPQTMSLVSFDLYGVSAITCPATTTIHQPLEEMGRCVADIMVEKGYSTGINIIFSSKIIRGDSIRNLN